jgi:hypothetical protein
MPAKVSQAIRLEPGKYLAGQPDRADFPATQFKAGRLQVMFQEGVIKIYVMCYEYPVL